MPRKQVCELVEVECAYCSKKLIKSMNKRNRASVRFFCDQGHYWAWLGEQTQPLYQVYSDSELVDELRRVAKVLGHAPTFEEMEARGRIYPSTYQKRFGTWEQVKRLIGWQPDYESFDPIWVDPIDGAWLSGLIDGEGCFRLQGPSPSNIANDSRAYSLTFTISLRTDSISALDELCRIIGSKGEYHVDNREALIKKGQKNAKPVFKYFLRDLPTLAYHLIPILEKYPLRTKKRYDLIIFKLAASVLLNKWLEGRKNKAYTDSERDLLARLFLALKEIKLYESTFEGVIAKYNLPIDPTAHQPTPSSESVL